jgi:hypothetical protein
MLYQYLADAPVSEIQKSMIHNDYGRTDPRRLRVTQRRHCNKESGYREFA